MAKRESPDKKPRGGPAGFRKPVRRDARIDLRVTPAELDEMKAAADGLGLTLSEYLRQCHEIAKPLLDNQGKGA